MKPREPLNDGGSVMEFDIAVKVRGRGHLVAKAMPERLGVRVRIDDDRNPEFWAECYIPWAHISKLRELAEDAT